MCTDWVHTNLGLGQKMNWHTYYRVAGNWSLWIEKSGSYWHLYLMPKNGGNYLIGSAVTPQQCARMLSGSKKFPEDWIRVGYASV